MSEEEKETFLAKRSRITVQLVGAAIFSALSLVVSLLVVPILPRTPEGMAFFDPVSIIWMLCFLIFGPTAGLLCCVIGMFLLMPFDPFAPIGPLMKFAATVSLMIVPIVLLKLYKREEGILKSKILKDRKKYVIYGLLGTGFRIVVMVILNIIVYLALFGEAGLAYWIIIVIIVNTLQSLWDLLIPYLIVFGSKLDEKFEIW
jgi:riboflavin transporter FmnP